MGKRRPPQHTHIHERGTQKERDNEEIKGRFCAPLFFLEKKKEGKKEERKQTFFLPQIYQCRRLLHSPIVSFMASGHRALIRPVLVFVLLFAFCFCFLRKPIRFISNFPFDVVEFFVFCFLFSVFFSFDMSFRCRIELSLRISICT